MEEGANSENLGSTVFPGVQIPLFCVSVLKETEESASCWISSSFSFFLSSIFSFTLVIKGPGRLNWICLFIVIIIYFTS